MSRLVDVGPDALPELAVEVDETGLPDFKIEHMPDELQEVAEALAGGLTVAQMRDLGISRRALDRAKQGIEDWLVGRGHYSPKYNYC